MRDPKQIQRILDLLEFCWLKRSDLRLIQLLYNIAPPYLVGDSYYLEDDKLEQLLKEYHEETCPGYM